jgi:hypothetical protein
VPGCDFIILKQLEITNENYLGGNMKKLLLLVVALLATNIFASDWYTKQDFVTDLKTHLTSKDTTWNTYAWGAEGYIWNPITRERGTFMMFPISDYLIR